MRRSTKVELPDGRLITIEGGNANAVANVIATRIDSSLIVQNEEPLEMPAMSFKAPDQPVTTQPLVTSEEDDEAPLVMPPMQF